MIENLSFHVKYRYIVDPERFSRQSTLGRSNLRVHMEHKAGFLAYLLVFGCVSFLPCSARADRFDDASARRTEVEKENALHGQLNVSPADQNKPDSAENGEPDVARDGHDTKTRRRGGLISASRNTRSSSWEEMMSMEEGERSPPWRSIGRRRRRMYGAAAVQKKEPRPFLFALAQHCSVADGDDGLYQKPPLAGLGWSHRNHENQPIFHPQRHVKASRVHSHFRGEK